MSRSNSNPDLFLFDPKIERTLRRAWQVKRQVELENTLRSQAARLESNNDFIHLSDSDSDSCTTSSDTAGTFIMGETLTLKQIGGASMKRLVPSYSQDRFRIPCCLKTRSLL
ncbi:hypothetical protein PIB30_019267 [Stylosanthes scabra]|uniref:Uncharacterized protein n=1 Tax=Stylosanthes scabra TaxID=79078 RepID=A0ABU6T8I1_9FABA|nr:hypothetical protein [Stylosanthes scabra]